MLVHQSLVTHLILTKRECLLCEDFSSTYADLGAKLTEVTSES